MFTYYNNKIICPYSLSSIFLEVKTFNKCNPMKTITISTATGFLYHHKKTTFLVSNWHIFSGKEFDGEYKTELKDPNGAIPELFTLHGTKPNNSYDIRIVNDDLLPLWIKHPQKQVDIAAIPLSNNDIAKIRQLEIYPINELPSQEDMFIEIASDVFISGYPYGKKANTAPGFFPIFKRGSVASEPEFEFYNGRKCFIIDSTTRKGMSGSPVIQISQDGYTTKDGSICMDCTTHYKFLGIYSGRVKEDSNQESSLGIVWDKSLIQEILASFDRTAQSFHESS